MERSKKYAVYFFEEEKLLKKGKEEGVAIGEKTGEIKGRQKGKKEGEKNKAIKIAKTMLSKKVKVDDIADFT